MNPAALDKKVQRMLANHKADRITNDEAVRGIRSLLRTSDVSEWLIVTDTRSRRVSHAAAIRKALYP